MKQIYCNFVYIDYTNQKFGLKIDFLNLFSYQYFQARFSSSRMSYIRVICIISNMTSQINSIQNDDRNYYSKWRPELVTELYYIIIWRSCSNTTAVKKVNYTWHCRSLIKDPKYKRKPEPYMVNMVNLSLPVAECDKSLFALAIGKVCIHSKARVRQMITAKICPKTVQFDLV